MTARHQRILVVEDSADARRMLVRRLSRSGYVTSEASSGRQALEVLKSETPDLVLLDVEMPGMSGLKVVDEIRQNSTLRGLPIIMTTGLSESGDVVNALEMGANDYVTKPIDYPVLLARVRTHLRLKELADIKDDFLGIASHELKNPLTRVLGAVKLVFASVRPGTEMPVVHHEMLERALRATEEMQSLVEDFLDFQALNEGRLELTLSSVDLCALVRSVVADNRELSSRKGITIEVEAAEGLERPADPSRVRQVVRNLVDNAIKFSPEGGRIWITCSAEEDEAVIRVRDQGPGISEEDLPFLFDRYRRANARPTGGESSTGLGLSICKMLVDLHGGSIDVAASAPGSGTTFEVRLQGRVGPPRTTALPERE